MAGHTPIPDAELDEMEEDTMGAVAGDVSITDMLSLIAEVRALRKAAEQMLFYEDAGGDGWWRGWAMLKAALPAPSERRD